MKKLLLTLALCLGISHLSQAQTFVYSNWAEPFYSATQTGEYGDAIQYIRPFADKGNAAAQYHLGLCYIRHNNDNTEAFKWFVKASDQGYAIAQFNVGRNYEEGWNCELDYAEAKRLYVAALYQDYFPAYSGLASLYREGRGVEKDLKKAFYYYKKYLKLAKGSYTYAVDALAKMGECYAEGIGVKQNNKKAVKYYKQALKIERSQAYNKEYALRSVVDEIITQLALLDDKI